VRRGLLALLAVLALTPLAAACQDDSKDAGGDFALTERWLRANEDPSADVAIFEAKLPDNLADLLNPSLPADSKDRIQFPVHPNGKLIGSYVIRRPEVGNLIGLVYDVAEPLADVTKKVQEQLDARPWQVVGAEADGTGTLMRFETTTGGDLRGQALVNQRPGTATYELVVDRGGKQTTLKVARTSAVPEIAGSLGDDLTVKRVDQGAAKVAGLKDGDKIVKVGGVDVNDRKSLAAAQRAMASEKTPSTSITYLLLATPSVEADKRTFSEPASLALPDKFPLKTFFDGLVVMEYEWVQQPGSSGFRAVAITKDSGTSVAGKLKDALQKGGWQIVQDVPSGGSTQMQFQHSDGRAGQAEIGPFEVDSAYTQVGFTVQSGQGGGG
jgi:hypothetical protein